VKEWQHKPGLTIAVFIVCTGVILSFNLWIRSLENHDYLRYAEIVREMIRSGDWVVPHLNGRIYVDKPPLTFWLIALPSSMYGTVTPLFGRLPSALSAWVAVIVVFFWARRLYGSTLSGLVSAGVLLSSYQFFFQARMAKTDMPLCLFILLSLYFFYLGYDREFGRDSGRESGPKFRGRAPLCFGLSFFFMGLGLLTKGPFGLMIPFPVIVAYLLKERRVRLLISGRFLLGYLILGLTVLPWVLLFVERVGLDRSITLMKESRALSRLAPAYFYFVQIWLQFFPWSLLIPVLGFYTWRHRRSLWRSEQSFLLLWFGILFLLLTFFKVRVSRYFLPALPPLAMMIGGMWRKKFSYFLIPFIVVILIWHGVEMIWIRKNIPSSPGMTLAGQLKPLIKRATLHGYRLDVSTLEEVNFYLDRTIPLIQKFAYRGEKGLFLMPLNVYEEFKNQSVTPALPISEFLYKEGKLVLISKE
jgi:4-amino-4-deoxy-L-arabinose transferase-like glycosyltransferase